ncbi:MAG: hypothetical protein RL235_618 [Chlamydiota bacterium]|jgi:hypothetical protein
MVSAISSSPDFFDDWETETSRESEEASLPVSQFFNPSGYNPGQIPGLVRRIERSAAEAAGLADLNVTSDLKERDAIEAERCQVVRDHAKHVRKAKTWGVLGRIAQYIVAGASVMVGISIGALTGPGLLLVIGGVLGIASEIFSDTSLYAKIARKFAETDELETKIAGRIQMYVSLLAFGLSAGGCTWGIFGKTIARAATLQKAAEGIGLVASLGGLTAKFGQSMAERRSAHAEASLHLLDGDSLVVRSRLGDQIRNAQDWAQIPSDAASAAQEMIRPIAPPEF